MQNVLAQVHFTRSYYL